MNSLLLIMLYLCVAVCWGAFVLAYVYGERNMTAWRWMLIPFVILLWPALAAFGALLIFVLPNKKILNLNVFGKKHKDMFEDLSVMVFDAIDATGYEHPSSHLRLMADYIKENKPA